MDGEMLIQKHLNFVSFANGTVLSDWFIFLSPAIAFNGDYARDELVQEHIDLIRWCLLHFTVEVMLISLNIPFIFIVATIGWLGLATPLQ